MKNRGLILTGLLLAITTLACSIGPLFQPTPTPRPTITPVPTFTPIPTPIPLLGLEGRWEDPETLTVHTIEWQSGRYVVVSCIDEDGRSFPVTEQNWDGSTLTWTYYVASSDVSVGFETTSLNGDSLNTNWWNSIGRSGTEILYRVR